MRKINKENTFSSRPTGGGIIRLSKELPQVRSDILRTLLTFDKPTEA
jgi:hypothetical protein